MAKITELPAAGPITGTERIPVFQDGGEVGVAVSGAKVMPAQGTFAANTPPGSLAYSPNQTGGPGPIYFDGSQWRTLETGRVPVNYDGLGIWVVGISLSAGPAHRAQVDRGFYFYSQDGFIWVTKRIQDFDHGITNISYADGCWLAGGNTNSLGPVVGGYATVNSDPRNSLGWQIVPPYIGTGGPGTTADPPSAYNTNTGEFTVNFFPGGGTQQIKNPLPPSSNPDPTWPTIGQNIDGTSVLGMGTAGPVEVRIATKQLTIRQESEVHDIDGNPVSPVGDFGVWTTYYIQARKAGTGDYFPSHIYVNSPDQVIQRILAGNSGASAGMVLRGLVWGIVRELAVEFAPGGT